MTQSLALGEATVQDIQLELLRRTRFNDLDGARLCDSLQKHRSLWKAVLLDRPGLANFHGQGMLLTSGLIKLRDLSRNIWNADQLFILTPSPEDARALATIATDEDWGGEVTVHEDRRATDMALGFGRQTYGLLSIWWD